MFKPKNHRFGFFIGYMMYHFLSLTVLSNENCLKRPFLSTTSPLEWDVVYGWSPMQIGKYSFRKWIWTVCRFMKQKCYFQRGVAECRHAATPLSSYSNNTTLQGFQKRYITLLYLKGIKSYQPSKFKCLHFTPLTLVNRTFHLHFCWYLLSPLRYKKVKYLIWKPWSVVLML